jgi:hypothetical protein
MPAERRPKNLHDVSHLFLSRSSQPRASAPRPAEALLWLVTQERLVNRAHTAAGFCYALACKDLSVTLLEFISGLPSVGYYFGIDGSQYLKPSLDDTAIVTGRVEQRIEFACCRRAASLERFTAARPAIDRPRVVLAAFELSGSTLERSFSLEVEEQCGRVAGGSGAPDAAVVVADAVAAGPMIGIIEDRFPGVLVFRVVCGPEAGTSSAASETYLLPEEIRSSWGARTAPKEPFFDGLASNVLQVISYQRKAVER